MKRYLNPPTKDKTIKEHNPIGYTFEHEGKHYTIYADTKERASRVFEQLCLTHEINLLVPNP